MIDGAEAIILSLEDAEAVLRIVNGLAGDLARAHGDSARFIEELETFFEGRRSERDIYDGLTKSVEARRGIEEAMRSLRGRGR